MWCLVPQKPCEGRAVTGDRTGTTAREDSCVAGAIMSDFLEQNLTLTIIYSHPIQLHSYLLLLLLLFQLLASLSMA